MKVQSPAARGLGVELSLSGLHGRGWVLSSLDANWTRTVMHLQEAACGHRDALLGQAEDWVE